LALAFLASSCRARSSTDFKDRLRLAEIKTQDFPAWTNSTKRRSLVGRLVTLSSRSASHFVANLFPSHRRIEARRRCAGNWGGLFVAPASFLFLVTPNPTLKPGGAVLPGGTVSRTNRERARSMSPTGRVSFRLAIMASFYWGDRTIEADQIQTARKATRHRQRSEPSSPS
jgi:hypothetical protein